MRSTESMEQRLKRVDMHEYFLDRIKSSMESENYIEASWLIYSCFENRYFRMIEKVREHCKYCRAKSKCNHKQKNELALATKIRCIQRLHNAFVPCISGAFPYRLFDDTLKWIKGRNDLMHELLSLDYYQDSDARFKNSAEEGAVLLDETYKACTMFRKLFYDDGYDFVFPIEAMEGCSCKPQDKAEV